MSHFVSIELIEDVAGDLSKGEGKDVLYRSSLQQYTYSQINSIICLSRRKLLEQLNFYFSIFLGQNNLQTSTSNEAYTIIKILKVARWSSTRFTVRGGAGEELMSSLLRHAIVKLGRLIEDPKRECDKQ